MGAAGTGKPPPLVCFKWPWSPNPNPKPTPSPSPSPCGDLELPWLFKSIRNLAQGLVIAGDLPSSPASSAGGGGLWGRQRRGTDAAVVEADRGDAEQRALAAALATGRPATVLEFYSPRCRLCPRCRTSCASSRMVPVVPPASCSLTPRMIGGSLSFCIMISDTSLALCSWINTAEL